MVINYGKTNPNNYASSVSISEMRSMLALHSYITKRIIKGDSLTSLLESLTIKLEKYFKWKLYASVLLREEGGKLVVAAAPNLPEAFKKVMYPLSLGSTFGFSGTAAFLNRPIITSDIEQEPFWANYRDVAVSFGIKACWSIPITVSGQTVGILAFYHTKVCTPTEFELEMFETCANLAGLAIDRDKRIQLEKELGASKREKEDILKNNNGMIFKFKKVNGRFIYTFGAGQLFERLGLPLEEFEGKTLYDIQSFSEAKRKERVYEQAWRGEETTYEARVKDIHYVGTLKPIYDNGKVIEVLVSCKDITKQKRVEQQLQKSNQRFQSLFYSNPDLVYSLDLNGNITNINPSVQRLLSYPPAEMIGKDFANFVEGGSLFHTNQSFYNALKGVPQTYETLLLKSNGDSVPFQVTNIPIIVNCQYVGVYGIAKDLTEVKKAEEFLRKSDRLTAIGQLAAGIAHEIRNPLTSIKGFLQFLQEKSENQYYYKIMKREIDRIELITNEFLILAKPQATKYCQNSIEFILRSFLPLVETQAHLSNIEIMTKIEDHLPAIYCDSNQIKQVFLNIIKNSIESMPNGGKVTICIEQKDNYLKIIIADQGCGIKPERLKRIGEPFYSTKEKGTGLGLMIIFKIIKEHQGDIQIHSEPNKGTEVEIKLPINS